MVKCPYCDNGVITRYGCDICPSCHGNVPQLPQNPCWTCNNTGYIKTTVVAQCQNCHGSGVI